MLWQKQPGCIQNCNALLAKITVVPAKNSNRNHLHHAQIFLLVMLVRFNR